MTMMSYVACSVYPVYEPRTFFFPSGFGTLGFSLPAAIGAKIGRPEAGVVAVVGDGGFQYTMGDLGCAVQERLGLPIVIFNDATYSAVKHAQMEERGGRYMAVDLVNPDYVKLADAYGIPGVRADSPEELEREIELAFERELADHHRRAHRSLGLVARAASIRSSLSTRRGCTIATAALAIPAKQQHSAQPIPSIDPIYNLDVRTRSRRGHDHIAIFILCDSGGFAVHGRGPAGKPVPADFECRRGLREIVH